MKRQQQLIERTAAFVASHGERMEVKMKVDKAKEPQFSFLNLGDSLNSYYKQLVRLIKAGKHKPVIEEMAPRPPANKVSEDDSDTNSDDSDGYLHPSLFGGGAKRSTQGSVHPHPQVNIYSTTYGKLLERLKPFVPQKPAEPEPVIDTVTAESEKQNTSSETSMSHGKVIPPPPDVKIYVDKLADYVARNGPAFEDKVRQREDNRFDFVKPDNLYYAYYKQRVTVSQKAWVEKVQQKIKFEIHKPQSSSSVRNAPEFELENSLDNEISHQDSNSSVTSSTNDNFDKIMMSLEAKPSEQELAEKKKKEEEQQRLSKLLSVARERYAKIQMQRKMGDKDVSDDDNAKQLEDSEEKITPSEANDKTKNGEGEQVPAPITVRSVERSEHPRRENRPSRDRWDRRREERPRRRSRSRSSISSRSSLSSRSRSRSRSRRRRSRSRSRSRRYGTNRRHSSRNRRHHRRSSSRHRSKRHRSRSRSREWRRSRRKSPKRDEASGIPTVALPPEGLFPISSVSLPDSEKPVEEKAMSEDEVWRQLEMLDEPTKNNMTKNDSNNSNDAPGTGFNEDEVVMTIGARKEKPIVVAEPVKIGEEIKAINVLQRLKALRRQEEDSIAAPASKTQSSFAISSAPRIPNFDSSQATVSQLKAQEDIKNSLLSKLRQSFQSS